MNTEEKLKELILSRYGSVRNFTQKAGMPYSTVATIFKKGVSQTNVTTIIKICQMLNISTDELAQGRISFLDDAKDNKTVEDLYMDFTIALRNTPALTLNGEPMSDTDIDTFIKSMNIVIELERGLRNGNT